MSQTESPVPDIRPAQLEWFKDQVKKRISAFTQDEQRFLLVELKVNPTGEGFIADDKHIDDAPFRSRLHGRLEQFPPFEGKRLKRIHKPVQKRCLLLEWDEASSASSSPEVENDDDYSLLKERLQNQEVAKVLLIQHWGQSSDMLRDFLVTKTKAKIELYIQNPDEACCAEQKGKISRFISEFERRAKFRGQSIKERVKVFVSDMPATIRAVLVDDRVLAIGWYVYYPKNALDSKFDIQGRGLPTIYATNDWAGFSKLKQVIEFWQNEVQSHCRQIFPPSGDSGLLPPAQDQHPQIAVARDKRTKRGRAGSEVSKNRKSKI